MDVRGSVTCYLLTPTRFGCGTGMTMHGPCPDSPVWEHGGEKLTASVASLEWQLAPTLQKSDGNLRSFESGHLFRL